MTRPRAADDFAAIRARMEELRGQRDQVARGVAPVLEPYNGRPRAKSAGPTEYQLKLFRDRRRIVKQSRE